MVRALLSGISLLVACAPALAQQGEPAADMLPSLSAPWLAHLAITLIGMMFAVRLALEAFARRSVSLADIPIATALGRNHSGRSTQSTFGGSCMVRPL